MVSSRLTLMLLVALTACAALAPLPSPAGEETAGSRPPLATAADRSPVDLVLTPDETRLLTVNQASATASLVRVADGKVLAEVPVGERPTAVALTPDGATALVSGTYGGDVTFLAVEGESLRPLGRVRLGFEPRGVAVSPDGARAYVALTSGSAVAVLDVPGRKELSRIPTGRWPRYLALSPDGKRLAVGVSGDGGVAVLDPAAGKQLWVEDFVGINLGQMHPSKDGKYVYVPWMVYRHNPITAANIRIGWVLASRIARIRLDAPARREAISLDPQGLAVADPHGLALSPDEQWMVCSASGTHELLVYKLPGLPFKDFGGPGDHIDAALLKDQERFYRVPLGGRPMAVRYSRDGKHAFVANAISDAVQVVDVPGRKVARELPLGPPHEPSLARRGEAIFFDGKRSLDQWYSCHSCHYEGHTNAVTMDTRNDGRDRNFKTVLSLRNVTRTGPWTWHGWQKNIELAMTKSLTDSMLGPQPKDGEVEALVAYLGTLRPPPNPHRQPDGSLSEAAKRGEAVFRSEKADCARCHRGEFLTDNKVHDVDTGKPGDVYHGFNTPSLVGVFDKVRYLHDGRARTLEKVLTDAHDPDVVTGRGKLTPAELHDLIEYLKSL